VRDVLWIEADTSVWPYRDVVINGKAPLDTCGQIRIVDRQNQFPPVENARRHRDEVPAAHFAAEGTS
jgi:hypothetical protein